MDDALRYDLTFGDASVLDEDDTDDSFSKRMIREINSTRAANAQSDRPRAFRNARSNVHLTLEALERVDKANDFPPEQHATSERGSQSSGGASDPPLNIPRDWGRKGRKRNDWLKRIVLPSNEKAGSAEDDWVEAAADVPLPSVEDSPLSQRATRLRRNPASFLSREESLERFEDSELGLELTEASLIASTPAAVTRNPVLDEIRQRERETAREDRIYPSPPPEEPQEERTEPATRPARRDTIRITQTVSETWTRTPATAERQENQTASKLIEKTSAESSDPSKHVSSQAGENDAPQSHKPNTTQPKPKPRRGAHDILKALARAASSTPSPARAQAPDSVPDEQPAQEEELRRSIIETPSAAPKASGIFQRTTLGRSVSDKVSERRSLDKQSRLFHEITSLIDTPPPDTAPRIVTKPAERMAASTLPKQLEPPTPVVKTGGWVDTPAPTRSKSTVRADPAEKSATTEKSTTSKEKAPIQAEPLPPTSRDFQPSSKSDPTPRVRKEPELPRSALAAIIARAKRGQAEDPMGDATITSLEDIVLTPDATFDDGDITVDATPEVQPPRSASKKQRDDEVSTLKNMDARLKTLRDSIHDTRLGLMRVEKKVHPTEKQRSSSPEQTPTVSGQCKCNENMARGPFQALWGAFKSLFYHRRNGSLKLTWLGAAFAVFWIWFITETIMCIIYCRPIYASYLTDEGIYPDAPEAPFVIPTMLFRPFRPIWRPVLNTAATFFHWAWGFASYILAEGRAPDVAKEAFTATTKVASQTVETDMSMMGDELL
ncbi:hypothetical protein EJ06DRAFT_532195 [Trichodelitschia bisporula]|uniref:Uncharacterized protein n=1 Tax=Trichodelitschia bisporula TaxID=703511 RepID=A0A6G1HRE9_9PEZI|nr:hypothetical protein EJ06DRAFT_532195 [Trichodelitschia bisporula]